VSGGKSTMSEPLIQTSTHGEGSRRIGLAKLNRPKQLNALNDALMDELGLERMDRRAHEVAALKKETYFINRRHYSEAQAAREFVPLAKQILEHYDSMKEVVNYASEGGGGTFDRMSMAEYFDGIDAKGWMRELLEVAYVTEYGLEADEQSAGDITCHSRSVRVTASRSN
jgi:hypothetical protein